MSDVAINNVSKVVMPPAMMLRARLRAATGRPEARLSLADRLTERGATIAAARQIAAAAKDGMPAAQARLGLCYLHGNGVPANQSEARHWLERAADGGDARAQTELASLALRGVSGPYRRDTFASPPTADTKPDIPLAAELARRAAKHRIRRGPGVARLHPEFDPRDRRVPR